MFRKIRRFLVQQTVVVPPTEGVVTEGRSRIQQSSVALRYKKEKHDLTSKNKNGSSSGSSFSNPSPLQRSSYAYVPPPSTPKTPQRRPQEQHKSTEHSFYSSSQKSSFNSSAPSTSSSSYSSMQRQKEAVQKRSKKLTPFHTYATEDIHRELLRFGRRLTSQSSGSSGSNNSGGQHSQRQHLSAVIDEMILRSHDLPIKAFRDGCYMATNAGLYARAVELTLRRARTKSTGIHVQEFTLYETVIDAAMRLKSPRMLADLAATALPKLLAFPEEVPSELAIFRAFWGCYVLEYWARKQQSQKRREQTSNDGIHPHQKELAMGEEDQQTQTVSRNPLMPGRKETLEKMQEERRKRQNEKQKTEDGSSDEITPESCQQCARFIFDLILKFNEDYFTSSWKMKAAEKEIAATREERERIVRRTEEEDLFEKQEQYERGTEEEFKFDENGKEIPTIIQNDDFEDFWKANSSSSSSSNADEVFHYVQKRVRRCVAYASAAGIRDKGEMSFYELCYQYWFRSSPMARSRDYREKNQEKTGKENIPSRILKDNVLSQQHFSPTLVIALIKSCEAAGDVDQALFYFQSYLQRGNMNSRNNINEAAAVGVKDDDMPPSASKDDSATTTGATEEVEELVVHTILRVLTNVKAYDRVVKLVNELGEKGYQPSSSVTALIMKAAAERQDAVLVYRGLEQVMSQQEHSPSPFEVFTSLFALAKCGVSTFPRVLETCVSNNLISGAKEDTAYLMLQHALNVPHALQLCDQVVQQLEEQHEPLTERIMSLILQIHLRCETAEFLKLYQRFVAIIRGQRGGGDSGHHRTVKHRKQWVDLLVFWADRRRYFLTTQERRYIVEQLELFQMTNLSGSTTDGMRAHIFLILQDARLRPRERFAQNNGEIVAFPSTHLKDTRTHFLRAGRRVLVYHRAADVPQRKMEERRKEKKKKGAKPRSCSSTHHAEGTSAALVIAPEMMMKEQKRPASPFFALSGGLVKSYRSPPNANATLGVNTLRYSLLSLEYHHLSEMSKKAAAVADEKVMQQCQSHQEEYEEEEFVEDQKEKKYHHDHHHKKQEVNGEESLLNWGDGQKQKVTPEEDPSVNSAAGSHILASVELYEQLQSDPQQYW